MIGSTRLETSLPSRQRALPEGFGHQLPFVFVEHLPMKGRSVQVSVWGAGFLNLPQASSSLTRSRASAPVYTFFCDLTADCAAI